eukprot:2247176-Rhodomonas_salina.1
MMIRRWPVVSVKQIELGVATCVSPVKGVLRMQYCAPPPRSSTVSTGCSASVVTGRSRECPRCSMPPPTCEAYVEKRT